MLTGVGQNTLPYGRVSESSRLAKSDRVNGSWPIGYLITFTTYGTWLHGDARGSVDPAHNVPGTPLVDEDPHRRNSDHRCLKHRCITLDAKRRSVVRGTIMEAAEYRGWTIHALNVRTNHVHIVVGADETPERVMTTVKSWATRRMREEGVLDPGSKAWTRHGSTRYLWKPEQLEAACRYVCEGQGVDLEGSE